MVPLKLPIDYDPSVQSQSIHIQPIPAEATVDLRHAVLRAGYARDEAIFAGDRDVDTLHLGAMNRGGAMIGVASLYREGMSAGPQQPAGGVESMGDHQGHDASGCEPNWRLRGMAVAESERGQGVGSALLAECIDHIRERGGTILWCNARTPAVGFYRQHGFETVGDEFHVPTAGPHYRMILRL